MLERLLKRIIAQETNNLFNYSIIIIDNDAKGGARELARRIKERSKLDIIYEIEPMRSIPAARNHAISLAAGNYIAIIDDDELPPPNWLVTLFRAIQTFDVDGALGPILPYFDQKPPSWLIKGKFCERPVYRTGTILEWHQTRTGNVLLKRKVFDEHSLKFDLKFKTSSSDRAFFMKAIELGYKFVAVSEAPVYEIVPPERWKKSYYLRRAIVQGYNSWQYRKKKSRLISKIGLTLKSVMALFLYMLMFPFSFLLGQHLFVQLIEKSAYHLSQILARFNIELIKRRDF